MKYLNIFFCFSLLFACKTSASKANQVNTVTTTCPTDGICSVEMMPNSTLNFLNDSTNSIYLKIESGNKNVFKFSYDRQYEQEYADGFYREEIYFEFDSDIQSLHLKNEELSEVNLHLNRSCFCKGSAGFFPIDKGELLLKKIDDNSFQFTLHFKLNNIPHIITAIQETVMLK